MSFICPAKWGIFVGIKILLLGIIHAPLCLRYKINVLKSFFISLIVIGVIIIELGIYYRFSLIRFIELDVSIFFGLYIGYVLMCTYLHINQEFILSRIIAINSSITK